jgi:hypothetical protein
MFKTSEEVSEWVRSEAARVNPYTRTLSRELWLIGFLSAVIAQMIWRDNQQLQVFRTCVRVKETKSKHMGLKAERDSY